MMLPWTTDPFANRLRGYQLHIQAPGEEGWLGGFMVEVGDDPFPPSVPP